ncbi:DUF3344 domain-containing protein [Methanoregula sp.]|uniref:DUF3344 domain-containing protein n=1 Tax=Methanoregula sp. TaxID=2052170 RepID=UPI0023756C87|nr:DUF3344 domain-containing protein [Methanoregula sp.]MDD1686718.1 DUF3344 domain-containing protein [Methanoregula sp.]
MLSLAGVVSADSAWLGTVPVTTLTGTVTGNVNVTFANTWNSDNPVDNDNTTGAFTLPTNEISNVQFARLYVVPYTGNMTEAWNGTLTVKLYRNNVGNVTLVENQPLDLVYVNTTGTVCDSTISVPPFTSTTNGLCRVTSDYVSIFDVKDYINQSDIKLYISTTNVSGRFDGRIKEAKLVYGWNADNGATTRYWINEGQDPSTYYDDAYTADTVFAVPSGGTVSSATLYTDDIASANGAYQWNYDTVTPTTTLGSNSYARLNKFTLATNTINLGQENSLTYDRYGTNKWYKLGVAVLKITYSS